MTNKTKLAALRDYFIDGGSTEETDVMEFLETTSVEVVDEYAAALKKKYPEDFPSAEEPVAPTTHFLKSDGLLKELEIIKIKDGRVIFEVKEPKDLVTILIKGKPVEVDLFKLRKLSPETEVHGVVVSLLIGLAEIAKS